MLKILKNLLPQALKQEAKARLHFGYRRSYSHDAEDILIKRALDIYFPAATLSWLYVDIGANHPVFSSNTFAFYRDGWTGIIVEPDANSCRLFTRLRPKDTVVNAAISDRCGSASYASFPISEYNSLITEDTAGRMAAVESKVGPPTITSVTVLTVEELLRERLPRATSPDLMSLDIEGGELTALRSNNWSLYRPKVLCVEVIRPQLMDVLSSQLHDYVTSNDYFLAASTYLSCIYVDGRSANANYISNNIDSIPIKG